MIFSRNSFTAVLLLPRFLEFSPRMQHAECILEFSNEIEFKVQREEKKSSGKCFENVIERLNESDLLRP